MASSSSNSAQTSSSRSWKYDVFISFRGEDTRKTFVDHLYSALVQRLIRVYKDDETLPRGDSIGPSLFKAIEESHIAVIVFSKNYADSSWCLDELSQIMKCRDEIGLIVMPIFYDVDPSEVRNQKRKFGEAFAKQEANNVSKAELWRKALYEASNIAGLEPKHIANGHETKVIKEIVDKIQDRLFPLDLDVDEELVGMRERLQDLISQLEIGRGGVRMVGIWGIGGSGKTTLAFSVYTQISHHFQGHCIVPNIREASSKHGLEALQQKILSTVSRTEVKVQSVEEGKHMLKSRLRNSTVLLLLDDVHDVHQLQVLAGSSKWFGSGSRIIITTRDKHLLRTHKVDHVSPIRLLSDEEAILLFYKYAFNERKPLTVYETLSLHVVSYAAGLPLALKVLGSFLFDKDESEWISALSKLNDIPNIEVMDILRISYDGLETLHKELFLDIACFFRWEKTDEAMVILDACGYYPVIGIKVLRQKSLITVLDDGRFDMHDLVQEMGHYIVRGEHPNNPEKHSRVWKNDEISNICYGMENNKIKALRYYGSLSHLRKTVSNMKKLRLLIMCTDNDDGQYAEGPNFLSNELKYLCWKCYPASPFPDSFQPLNLIVLSMHFSLQKELWNGHKHLPQLKVLQLHFMNNLLSTPDFGGLPCLQKLIILSCSKLVEIHPSLGNHRSLEHVHVSRCHKLRMFPTIVQMKKLKTLEIENCDFVIDLLDIQLNMESLVKLSLERIQKTFVPSSIKERHTQVETVFYQSARIIRKLYIQKFNFSNLRQLNFSGLGLKDGLIDSRIGELSNLEELDLSRNDFSQLHFSLSQLTQLKILILSECKWLAELPKLPSNVGILKADNCKSLTTVGDCHTNCKWLYNVSLVGGGIVSDGSSLLQSMLQARTIMILRLEGLEIKTRFLPPVVRGNKYTVQLQENWFNDFCGFLMCAVSQYCLNYVEITMKQVMSSGMVNTDSHTAWNEFYDDCKGKWVGSDDVSWVETSTWLGLGYDDDVIDGSKRIWLGYVPFGLLKHTLWWDETHGAISISFGSYLACQFFGFKLLPKTTGIALTETSTSSPDFTDYEPTLKILQDSASALITSLSMFGKPVSL